MNAPWPTFCRRVRHALLALAAALAFAFTAIEPSIANSPPVKASDQEVKAALLFRAAKFIEWPSSAFAGSQAPFVMCVVGDEERVRTFQPIQGKALNSRVVVIRRITGDMLDLGQCHIAFFPDDSDADVDYALGKLQSAPVLTVGESDAFVRRGGTLALITRDQRVQFTIHLAASKRAQLKVSSQLLQLATVAGEDSP